jgi:hypothetical protein
LHSRKSDTVCHAAYTALCKFLEVAAVPHETDGNILRTGPFSIRNVLTQDYGLPPQQEDFSICLSIGCAQSELQNQQNGLDPCGRVAAMQKSRRAFAAPPGSYDVFLMLHFGLGKNDDHREQALRVNKLVSRVVYAIPP